MNNLISDVAQGEIFFEGDLVECAQSNLWMLCISRKEYGYLHEEKLSAYLSDIRDVIAKKWSGKSFVFYCWFDLLAGQVRLSSIPGYDARPPFRRDITISSDIKDIAAIAMDAYSDMYLDTNMYENNSDELIVYVKRYCA